MRRHFRFWYKRTVTPDTVEQEILSQLSTPLRQEALQHVFSQILRQIPPFGILQDEYVHSHGQYTHTPATDVEGICCVLLACTRSRV
jgi:hypothetical protein